MKKKAFTLVELIAVVAILGILLMISIPNFLNAQIRAKVTRMQNDLDAVGIAIESYRLDNGSPPYLPQPSLYPDPPYGADWYSDYSELIAPTAYIASIPVDIFDYNADWGYYATIKYTSNARGYWYVLSFGPDEVVSGGGFNFCILYDPSNGIVSYGDIVLCNYRADNWWHRLVSEYPEGRFPR